MNKIRIIRMVVIEGEREWVEKTIENSIQGTCVIDRTKGNKIHSTTIGGFPEILDHNHNNDNNLRQEDGSFKTEKDFNEYVDLMKTYNEFLEEEKIND